MSLIESRLTRKETATDKYLVKILRTYLKDKDIELSKITPKWVERFFDFLTLEFETFIKKTPLKASTARLLGSRLTAALSEAVKMDLIKDNPCKKVKAIKAEESQRTYLTQEELKRLASTPYKRGERVTKAFLFSCLTGLRFSDVSKLRWAEVSEDFKRITFVQKKTSGLEYLDLSEGATKILKERKKDGGVVFHDLPGRPGNANKLLNNWRVRAGINKKISFHTARHTFATMLLTLDVDLYTVSKLLGHKDIKTTQIYAKIIDKKKRDAVNKIPQLF